MKLAIVGTTLNLNDEEQRVLRQEITIVLKKYPTDTLIISGAAKGVDSIAIEIAKNIGFKTREYKPEKEKWEFFKKRNLQLAKDCDELYCFSVGVKHLKCYHHDSLQNHEKTAGCWTLEKAKQLDKPCTLIVLSKYL